MSTSTFEERLPPVVERLAVNISHDSRDAQDYLATDEGRNELRQNMPQFRAAFNALAKIILEVDGTDG